MLDNPLLHLSACNVRSKEITRRPRVLFLSGREWDSYITQHGDWDSSGQRTELVGRAEKEGSDDVDFFEKY